MIVYASGKSEDKNVFTNRMATRINPRPGFINGGDTPISNEDRAFEPFLQSV